LPEITRLTISSSVTKRFYAFSFGKEFYG